MTCSKSSSLRLPGAMIACLVLLVTALAAPAIAKNYNSVKSNPAKLVILVDEFAIGIKEEHVNLIIPIGDFDDLPDLPVSGPLSHADFMRRHQGQIQRDRDLAGHVRSNPQAAYFVADTAPEGFSRIGNSHVIVRVGSDFIIGAVSPRRRRSAEDGEHWLVENFVRCRAYRSMPAACESGDTVYFVTR
jgi:hypothetical protein